MFVCLTEVFECRERTSKQLYIVSVFPPLLFEIIYKLTKISRITSCSAVTAHKENDAENS